MRGKSILLSALLSISPCIASTQVWIRTSGPETRHIVSPGCTNTIPMTCVLDSVAGLIAGDAVGIYGVCASDGIHNISAANGRRKIGAIVGSTISLTDLSGTPIAGNGAWCSGALGSEPAALQEVYKLTSMNMVDGIRGWLDGDNGQITREWALTTATGLTSFIVTGGTLGTFTYGFNHNLSTGDKVFLINSASTGSTGITPSGGKEYTVTVTGAKTYTIPLGTSVANQDWAHNDVCGPGTVPNGTIQGTDPCFVVSQRAVAANWQWQAVKTLINSQAASGAYRWGFDGGGGTFYGRQPVDAAASFALGFYIDRLNTGYLTAGVYVIDNIKRMGGNNFVASKTTADGGNYDLAAQASDQMANAGIAYSVFSKFRTTTQKKRTRDMLLNNISDSTPCTETLPVPISTDSGTAQAGSSTTIQLANTALTPVNGQIIKITDTGSAFQDKYYGSIQGYVGGTHIATVDCWTRGVGFDPCTGFNPSNGTPYSVMEGAQVSGTSQGSVTMTGFGTHWNTAGVGQKIVGDYVFLLTAWENGFQNTGAIGSIVTAVTDDAHLTVFNSSFVTALTTPQLIYASHDWDTITNACGAQWLQDFYVGNIGSQPISFPPRGGNFSGGMFGSNISMNLGAFEWTGMTAMVDDDDRAAEYLTKYGADNVTELAFAQSVMTGFTPAGVHYGMGRYSQGAFNILWEFAKTVQGFPSINIGPAAPWLIGWSRYKIFAANPEGPLAPPGFGGLFQLYGDAFGATKSNFGAGAPAASEAAMGYTIQFNPTSTEAAYENYWNRNVMGLTTSGSVTGTSLPEMAVKLDPRVPATDYRSIIPHQYYFHNTSCSGYSVPLSGYNSPCLWREDAVISRTGFSNKNDTVIQFRASSYITSDHDHAQPGDTKVYKAGCLLSDDGLPCGDSSNFNTVQFGTSGTGFKPDASNGGPAVASIPRFSGTDPTGDPNSDYACWTGDVAGSFTANPTRALHYGCHFKHSGDDEILIEFIDVVAASSTVISKHWMYPQNGETTASQGQAVLWDEGNTACPGAGGCGNLNATRSTDGVLEQEDGGGTDPIRQFNLISKFLFPGPGCIAWDGSAFSGATGHAYRASAYGSSTCGAASTALQVVGSHKVAVQPDGSFATSLLSAGGNWVGVQASNSVALFASDGLTHNAASFTTSYGGSGQVVVTSLDPGTYTVTRGGTPVSGSPFTVPDGNNSLKFSDIAGPIIVSQTASASGSSMGGTAKAGGKAVVH